MDDLQQLKTALYEETERLMLLLHYAGFPNVQFDRTTNVAPDCIYQLKEQFLMLQRIIPQMEGILESIKIINRKIKEYER